MITSFGDDLQFSIHVTDGTVPLPERKLIWSSEHIPGGDDNINESGGLGPLEWKAPIRILPSDLEAWRSRLGQTRVLIIDDINYGSVRLTALTNVRKTIRPAPATQYVLANVEMSS